MTDFLPRGRLLNTALDNENSQLGGTGGRDSDA
jgi:hypothetical protein